VLLGSFTRRSLLRLPAPRAGHPQKPTGSDPGCDSLPGLDKEVARLRELVAIRRRLGYRRLLVLIRREAEGLVMNHKKFRRFYRDERLQVRRRGGTLSIAG
jgi:hypothetical protein